MSGVDIEGNIKVKGGKIWYQIAGHESSGIPLLTIHGGPGAPHNYLKPLIAFKQERPVIFYDQLGCGNSERPNDLNLWTIERFVDELEQIRTELKLDKVHILGQSWGTMLALEYYLKKNPKGVMSLILSGPFLSTKIWMWDQMKWISLLPKNIQDNIKIHEKNEDFNSIEYQDAMMCFYRKHLCRIDPWPEDLIAAMEGMGMDVYLNMWGPSEFTMTGTLKDADLTSELHKINVPVLITCGEFDEATPETSKFYSEKISNSELHIFKDASHSHLLEKPEEYMDVVGSFIKKHE